MTAEDVARDASVSGMTSAEALERIPYLRNLPVPERASLAKSCEFRQMPRGASLFSEGDAPSGVFLIVEGRIKLLRSSQDGREQVLHEEGPGSTLAEVPVFDGQGYVASAVAAVDSLVFFVPRDPLLAALVRSPASAVEVIQVLAARVRKLAGVVEDLSLRPVLERIAAYLCREAVRQGSDSFELAVTRDELAAHVGTVREQVSRAFSELKAAGVIDVTGRKINVREPRKLRSMAHRS